MRKYLFRRCLIVLLTGLGILTLVFLLLRLAPGDPVEIMLGDYAAGTSLEARDTLRRELGLDRPLVMQYLNFLLNLARGDLGYSFRHGIPVHDTMIPHIAPTMLLAVAGVLVSILMGLPLGMYSALRRNTWGDYGATVFSTFFLSAPNFWLGLVLIYYFAFRIPAFPMAGTGADAGFMSMLHHLALPAFAIGARGAALTARMTRSTMLEVMQLDYIRTARAKDLAERLVVFRHALKNAAIPIATIIGLDIAYLLGGTVVIETVFARPGLGKLLVDALYMRDFPVVQGVVLYFALMVAAANFMVDVFYAVLNPRIRFE